MRINTDGVLLGCWMRILPNDYSFLDIGTGCGVISLILMQRIAEINTKYNILAIEPDKGSCMDAEENFESVKNNNEIKVMNISLQDYANLANKCSYDMIYTNPPYFVKSLKSSDSKRSNTRHADTLPQSDIILSALSLLKNGGRLNIILPLIEAELFLKKVEAINKLNIKYGEQLSLNRLCKVFTTENKPAKRYMMEFIKNNSIKELNPQYKTEELILMRDGTWTPSYISLVKDFYLNF